MKKQIIGIARISGIGHRVDNFHSFFYFFGLEVQNEKDNHDYNAIDACRHRNC